MQAFIANIGDFVAQEGRIIFAVGLVAAMYYAWRAISRSEFFLRWQVKLNPLSATARLHLGDHLSRYKHNEAEQAIEQAILLDPGLVEAYYSLADLQLSDNESLARAGQTIKRMRQLFPTDSSTYVYYGMLLERQQSNAEAEKAYRKAADLAPDRSWPYLRLGHLLGRKNQNFLGAEIAYREAIRNQPDNWIHYFNLGNLFAENEQYSEAIDCFRIVAKKRPDFLLGHVYLGLSLAAADRHAEAEKAVRGALKARHSSGYDEYHLGDFLRKMKHLKEAEDAFRRAIRKEPRFLPSYNDLGLLLCEQPERLREAEESYWQALSIDPCNTTANYNLATILRQTERAEEAIPLLQQAISSDPNDYDAILGLASIDRLAGKQASCMENAQKARAMIPCTDFYALACLEAICGNNDVALQHLAKALQEQTFERDWAWRDPDLAWLRDDPRFTELLGSGPS